jgi:hypothetical protein
MEMNRRVTRSHLSTGSLSVPSKIVKKSPELVKTQVKTTRSSLLHSNSNDNLSSSGGDLSDTSTTKNVIDSPLSLSKTNSQSKVTKNVPKTNSQIETRSNY